MKIFKSPIILAISSLMFFNSCKRTSEDTNQFGPELIVADASFTIENDSLYVMPITGATIDFNKGFNAYFKAKFSKKASWTLKIKSVLTGAVREFTGTSDSLSIANTLWSGQSDSLIFSNNDVCTATLSVLGLDNKWVTNFKSVSQPSLLKTGNAINFGAFANFDVSSEFAVSYGDKNDQIGFMKADPEYQGANGKFSLYVHALDGNGDGFCGGFEMETAVALIGKITSKDPENVYINAYVKGYGKPNSGVKFLLYELDTLNSDNPQAVINASNLVTEFPDVSKHSDLIKKNDRWEYQLNPSWVGWKLVSIKYSDFKKSKTDGGNGNGKMEPNKVREFTMEIGSYPTTTSEVEFAIDYLVLTQGGKFDPSN